jgi:hypothetical protein
MKLALTWIALLTITGGTIYGQSLAELKAVTVTGAFRDFGGGSLTLAFGTDNGKLLELELVNRLMVDDQGKAYVEGGDQVLVNYAYLYHKSALANGSDEEKKILQLLRQAAGQLNGETKDYLQLFSDLIATRDLALKAQLSKKGVPKPWRTKPAMTP